MSGTRDAAFPSPAREAWDGFAANRGALAALVFFGLVALAALLAPWIAPHDPVEQYRSSMLTPPVWEQGGSLRFLLGTDELGRDLLSRLLHGGRVSLGIGLASVLLSLLPGVALGLLAAFHPRWIAPPVMRVMDIMMALPGLLLAICVIAVLGPGLVNTVIAIAIGALPGYTRLTRAAALGEIHKEYVVASRVAGASTWRLMLVQVLPNCLAPLIVNATLSFSAAILEAAGLGFLGLGVQAPTAEWGGMLASARDYIQRAPWVVMLPGLTILCTVLSVNLMGDGLRDALDPKLRKLS
ncbi:ABC transporter permease subunit [Pelomonas sp. SE-A7]|uniref:ABC transporter permease n=1 Tax=Pelomonas sp. SE-A7 TaxID=3054953 RepID=UPI00259D264C|nr:ABC transporter permease subunit [Pelomonas sp. SE-A7]MDM4768162.1 ABC transporter permease subunit [Pelomonas sp. SE-A7]